MRERLKKDIKRKFGPVYWSKKLRDQRRELLSDALDRYDEELQKGAEPPTAYRAAYDSVGSTEALRASFGIDRRRRIFFFLLLSVLSVLLATPTVVLLILLTTETVILGWVLLAIVLSALMLALYCLWRLLTRDYFAKGWLIFGAVAGGLISVLLFLPMALWVISPDPNRVEQPYDTYSYADETEEIESVSYIHMEYRSHTLTYTVLDTVDRALWPDALLDLGIAPVYSHTYEPTEADGFLIRFRDGHDPASVIYGDRTFFIVPRSGSDAEQYGSYTKSEEWKQLLRKYVNTADN